MKAYLPRWPKLRTLRLENVTRMWDETTWDFVGHARACVAKTRSTLDWTEIAYWLLRTEFTCTPRTFGTGNTDVTRIEQVFRRQAYNHMNGTWSNLKKMIQQLNTDRVLEQEVASQVQRLVLQGHQVAVVAGRALMVTLENVKGLASFNIKEYVGLGILVREARQFTNGIGPEEKGVL